MFGIGTPELIIIAVIALLIFGPSKLPELGKTLGKGLREFKNASSNLKDQLNPLNDIDGTDHAKAEPEADNNLIENTKQEIKKPAKKRTAVKHQVQTKNTKKAEISSNFKSDKPPKKKSKTAVKPKD